MMIDNYENITKFKKTSYRIKANFQVLYNHNKREIIVINEHDDIKFPDILRIPIANMGLVEFDRVYFIKHLNRLLIGALHLKNKHFTFSKDYIPTFFNQYDR